ncbi:MAG: hypothetical protein FJ086_03475 [Deltaproteobacteria bacterium]|nr:hypothetical protein [Deltaproteobacteria bacterium]
MLTALALSSLLAAAPAPPRAHPAADGWAHAPRLDALSGLGEFSRVAGKSSALLRSAVFSEELLPLLQLDLTDARGLTAAGLDVAAPFTTSLLPAGRVACFGLSDPAAFRARAEAALRQEGPPWNGTLPGITSSAALRGAEPGLGYVLKGKTACIASAPRAGGAALLKSTAKLLGTTPPPPGWKEGKGLPGDFFLGTKDGAVMALRASAAGLSVEGRAGELPGGVPGPLGAGESPYASLTRTGPALLRARLEPGRTGAHARALASTLARACRECDGRAVDRALETLAPLLTGQVLLHVEGFRLKPPPRTHLARYFALRHAWVAEVKDAAAAARALEALGAARGLRRAGGGVVLPTPDGEVQVGLSGNHLYVANDGGARQSVLSALPGARAGQLPHGLVAELEAPSLGKALGGVSVLDAVGNAEAAGFFALALEVGPLLRSSGTLSGHADRSGGGQRFHLEWPLAPR